MFIFSLSILLNAPKKVLSIKPYNEFKFLRQKKYSELKRKYRFEKNNYLVKLCYPFPNLISTFASILIFISLVKYSQVWNVENNNKIS